MTHEKIIGIYASGTKKIVADLARLGINTIFTTPKSNYVRNAKNTNLDAYIHLWTFKAPEPAKKYGIKNILGEKLLWSGSGCPNNPEIKNRSLERIEKDASSLDIAGIILDGIRFPSLGNGLEAFLSCFCEHCYDTARDHALDLGEVRKELKCLFTDVDKFLCGIGSPIDMMQFLVNHRTVLDWIIFKCKSIEAHIQTVKQQMNKVGMGLDLGVALFTPSLAPLVGQNYQQLADHVDLIQPMVYHRGNGPACINHELVSLALTLPSNHEKQEVLEALYCIFWPEHQNFPKELDSLQKSGLPFEIVTVEINRALQLVQKAEIKLNPIVFIVESTEQELRQLIGHAKGLKTHGLSLFAYYDRFADMTIDLGELIETEPPDTPI